ncbi:MAG TPA: DNRLRE domain-containing protein [Candidatus Krumholzibacteria bacterium]|nr:DNRLRE domain-containing protein [Candidatus Krumholzibacteria bacterium]
MARRVDRLLLAWACTLAVVAPAGADTVTLGASKDNTIYENTALSNGAGQHLFAGRTTTTPPANQRVRRSLIAFDVGSIPAGATVQSATLTLHMSKTISGPTNIAAHRLLADWGEGTSVAGRGEGAGAAATTNDATWSFRFFNTASWSTPGGQFNATASATTSVNQAGDYSWTGSGLVADVQDWVNGTANFGWILRGNEVSILTTKRFDSRQVVTASFRPRLVVVFMPLPVEATTWSQVKALFR